jgi:hypothetical protein
MCEKNYKRLLYIEELDNCISVSESGEDISLLRECNLSYTYKAKLGCYDVEANFIKRDWDYTDYLDYLYDGGDEIPTSKVRIEVDLDKINIDNLEGIFVNIIPKQNCLKSIIGYKGDFYRGFEVLFKKRENSCEDLESFNWSPELILEDVYKGKQVSINIDKTYSYLSYFDNTNRRVDIQFDYTIGKPLEFVLEDFKIKGQVDLNIPCQISFTCFRAEGLLEVKVNNIMFYVENSLEFSINNKVANFEIKAR